MKIINVIAAIALTAATYACSTKPQWTVEGVIEDAPETVLLLEMNNNGRWITIDSVTTDSQGRFKSIQDPIGYPDIFRLRLKDDNRALYFPIDSIETVTVMAKADAFDTGYTLSGSTAAEMMMAVDRRLLKAIGEQGVTGAASDSLLKRELGGMLLGDPAGIVSYYIINKNIGGVRLFNPSNPSDLRIIGAVANAFSQFRPSDPRTNYLKNLYLASRRADGSLRPDTIYARQVGGFDISLFDNKGRSRSLSDLARQRKLVVLNFTSYAADESPAFNRILHNAWSAYHDQGLEIFQVSIDDDEHLWRQAAANLPWITVYQSPGESDQTLVNYNVTSLPATFILNRDGEVVERITDISTLNQAIGRHL